ncbi:MAG: transposase [Rhodospirillales bacterium]|nr:transposase [Rhodospirillales bacterium]
MWTPTTRRQHSRDGLRYETDLADKEWRLLEPHLPPPSRYGRPRAWPMREIVNAIFYVLRGGIAWRLPPNDFAPWPTVYRWFSAWRDAGLFERINHALVMADRERAGREASPSAASIQDRDGGGPLLGASRRPFPFTEKVFADSGYAGERVARATVIAVEIVRESPDRVGFAVQPRRWVVERFFAWIGRNRRVAKDFEATVDSARAFLYVASVMLLVRRLARSS